MAVVQSACGARRAVSSAKVARNTCFEGYLLCRVCIIAVPIRYLLGLRPWQIWYLKLLRLVDLEGTTVIVEQSVLKGTSLMKKPLYPHFVKRLVLVEKNTWADLLNFKCVLIVVVTVWICSIVECLALNPRWWSGIIINPVSVVRSLVYIISSKILHKVGSSDIGLSWTFWYDMKVYQIITRNLTEVEFPYYRSNFVGWTNFGAGALIYVGLDRHQYTWFGTKVFSW